MTGIQVVLFGLVYPLGQSKMSQCRQSEASSIIYVGVVGCILLWSLLFEGILLWTEFLESGKIVKLMGVQAD